MPAMKLIACAAALGALALCCNVAFAQSTDDGQGDEVELGDDPLPTGDMGSDPTGVEENPDAPNASASASATTTTRKKVEQPSEKTFPMELVARPITLPERMTEITYELPNSFNPYVQGSVLGARHGITDQIQGGLRYGTGALFDGEYFAGKAFALDFEYEIFPWLAAQLALPILTDPFAMSVSLGAPLKFHLGERLAFVGGRDIITFKAKRFMPSVANAAENEALAAADKLNDDLPEGQLSFTGAAIWQHKPNMAFDARVGFIYPLDAKSDQSTRDRILLDLGLLYSTSPKIDVGARMGFADLNETDSSFGLSLLAALHF